MKKNNIIIIGLFLLISLVACKSKEVASSSENAATIGFKKFNKKIEDANFKYNYFSGKARVSFNDGKINQSFTANLRMQKNETIWMSLTGPFGIEGGRVLMTKDSVQIIDRLNRKYYKEPFSYINNFIPFQVDLGFIQDIFVGNALHTSTNKSSINLNDGVYNATGKVDNIEIIYSLLPKLFKYQNVEANAPLDERTLKMTYNDYKNIEGESFSHKRSINFQEKEKKVDVDINFTKAKKEDKLEFPFSIPPRFKKAQ